MRRKTLAFLLALALPAALLTGCGSGSGDADAGDAAEDTAAAGESANADDPYAYLADFDYSALFDDKGYVTDIRALDYVTLPEGYAAPELPAGSDTVSDEDVDGMIEQEILYNFTETEQITDRAAEMGDAVNIDFVGSVDGVEFEGGSSGGSGYDITLGSGQFIEGFEEQIAGHTPGDSFDVVVTFPDPYKNDPDMAGKEAVFKTTLNYIGEEKLPELTDDFVAENLAEDTGCQTVEALQAFFRERMVYGQKSNAVYSQLEDSVTYADGMPQAMTDYFNEWALYNPWQTAVMYGMGLDDLLSQSGYDSTDQYLDSMQEAILSSARQVLLVQAMAEDMGLACDDATLEARFADTFGNSDIDTFREFYGDGYLKMSVLEHLVMEKILENATVAKE